MPRRTEPAQLARFLGMLELTGNITLAAERCGLAKSGLFKRRARDPAFAAALDAALAAARTGVAEASARGAVLQAGPNLTSDSGQMGVCPGRRRGFAQLRRVPAGRLTNEGLSAFLTRLAATANVRDAARSVGVASSSIYARRRADPQFRAAMDEAIEEGATTVEAAALSGALYAVGACPEPADGAEPPLAMTADDAFHLLRSHHAGHPTRRQRRPEPANNRAALFRREWTDEQIIARIENALRRFGAGEG